MTTYRVIDTTTGEWAGDYEATTPAEAIRAARQPCASSDPDDYAIATRWRVQEDSGAYVIIQAESLEEACEAAREWAEDGEYDERCMVEVRLQAIREDHTPLGPAEYIEVVVGPEPEEPECSHTDGHDWQQPYELVGGVRENPGVWSGVGTTMLYRDVCAHCGVYRDIKRTGAQRNPGELPEVITYEDADDASRAWVASRADA